MIVQYSKRYRSFTAALALLLASCAVPMYQVSAAEDETAKALKAAEELAVYSQSVVKDYFYVAKDLNAFMAKEQMGKYLKDIDANLALIKAAVKDPEVVELMDFMQLTLDDMKLMMAQAYSEDNAFLLLDMSEVLLEGADSIVKKLKVRATSEHEMLGLVEHQRFLLERMAKLYIAAKLGFFDFNSQQQMEAAVNDFHAGIEKLDAYSYPAEYEAKVLKLKRNWHASKGFYTRVEEGKLPRTVFLATEMMGYTLKPLAEYHLTHP